MDTLLTVSCNGKNIDKIPREKPLFSLPEQLPTLVHTSGKYLGIPMRADGQSVLTGPMPLSRENVEIDEQHLGLHCPASVRPLAAEAAAVRLK